MEAVQVNWPRKMSRRRGQRVKKSGQRERERKRISHKPLSEQEGTPNNTQKRGTEKRAGNLKKFTAAPPRLVPYLTSLIFIDNRSAHLHNSCILLSKNVDSTVIPFQKSSSDVSFLTSYPAPQFISSSFFGLDTI